MAFATLSSEELFTAAVYYRHAYQYLLSTSEISNSYSGTNRGLIGEWRTYESSSICPVESIQRDGRLRVRYGRSCV